MGVDRRPVPARDESWLTFVQPVGRGLCRGALAPRVAEVGQQVLDGRLGALLVRADDPARTALDPASDVLVLATGDAALVIRDETASFVERQSRHGSSAVADRAEHEPRGQRLGSARRACGERPVLAEDELVDRYDDALYAAV